MRARFALVIVVSGSHMWIHNVSVKCGVVFVNSLCMEAFVIAMAPASLCFCKKACVATQCTMWAARCLSLILISTLAQRSATQCLPCTQERRAIFGIHTAWRCAKVIMAPQQATGQSSAVGSIAWRVPEVAEGRMLHEAQRVR